MPKLPVENYGFKLLIINNLLYAFYGNPRPIAGPEMGQMPSKSTSTLPRDARAIQTQIRGIADAGRTRFPGILPPEPIGPFGVLTRMKPLR